MPRRPGRQQGVRRYRRHGQTALYLGSTLDPKFSELLSPEKKGRSPMIRVDGYTFENGKGRFLRSFDSIAQAVTFLRPLSLIPGNRIGLVIYDDERPVDVMLF